MGLAMARLSSLALEIFADVGVTVIVILNSLRLLRFEPNSALTRFVGRRAANESGRS